MVPHGKFSHCRASRLTGPVAQLPLTKALDPSVLPATLLLAATQEIPQRSLADKQSKTPGGTVKIHSVVTLIGLAISLALPTFAQQTNTPDPQIIEQLNASTKKIDEAFNNGDAAAVAALFTEDAVLVTDRGPIYGREAIEEYHAGLFMQFHFRNHLGKRDQYSPHIIGTAGNEVWSNGEWSTDYARQEPRRPYTAQGGLLGVD